MNTNEIIGMVIVCNLVVLKVLYHIVKSTKISLLKESKLGEEMKRVMQEWFKKVTTEYLPDDRIKVSFASPSVNVVFYVYHENDIVILSDHGDLGKKYDFTKTLNRGLLTRLKESFGLEYNGTALYIKSTLDQMDENMWRMFSAMIIIENSIY